MSCARFSDDQVVGQVVIDGSGYRVQGRTTTSHVPIRYWAANSPDSHLSVAGTALPFASEEIAFSASNSGNVVSDLVGFFEFTISRPNSYYSGRHLIPPGVHFAIRVGNREKVYFVPISAGYRDRSLSSLPNQPDRSYDR